MNLEQIKNSIQRWGEVRNTSLGLNFLTSGNGLEVKKSEYVKWDEIREESNIDIKDFYVHMYIGLVEFETTFFFVDSYTDKTKQYEIGENLFVKEFTKSTFLENENPVKEIQDIPNIDVTIIQKKGQKNANEDEEKMRAINSSFKWKLYSNLWFNNRQRDFLKEENNLSKDKGVVRLFKIPFQDFEDIFNNDTITIKTFLFFGIGDYYFDREKREGEIEFKDEIELYLCSLQKRNTLDANSTTIKAPIARDVTMPIPPYLTEGDGYNLL